MTGFALRRFELVIGWLWQIVACLCFYVAARSIYGANVPEQHPQYINPEWNMVLFPLLMIIASTFSVAGIALIRSWRRSALWQLLPLLIFLFVAWLFWKRDFG